MGMTRAEQLRTKLLAAGIPRATPVAVIANATRPDQDAVATSLAAFVEDARAAGLSNPAIIVVGKVAGPAALTVVDQARSRKGGGYI
jgi:uroporphyrin-III C-methyltransferase/precorrin-2 dehydrogenase/sirohydrochlorin ferrochelatase